MALTGEKNTQFSTKINHSSSIMVYLSSSFDSVDLDWPDGYELSQRCSHDEIAGNACSMSIGGCIKYLFPTNHGHTHKYSPMNSRVS